jgi:hypothetical protein
MKCLSKRALSLEKPFFVSFGHGIFSGIRPPQLYFKKIGLIEEPIFEVTIKYTIIF